MASSSKPTIPVSGDVVELPTVTTEVENKSQEQKKSSKQE